MQKLNIIKIGGNVIDDPETLRRFLEDFTALEGLKILVHGGGKVATQVATGLGIPVRMVDGRRITDEGMLRVVTMVYAGMVNKNIVAQLQAGGLNAIGLCGADGNIIPAVKRPVGKIDYGFVGDIESRQVGTGSLAILLNSGFSPVIAPLTHDTLGQLLNTNADTIAATLAMAVSERYEVKLFYCFEKKGVLLDPEDEESVIPEIDQQEYRRLKAEGIVSAGMIPKLDNAFSVIDHGVSSVFICRADTLLQAAAGGSGTRLY